ncbi:MAG: zinc ribbon domain-containing protein [Sphingomonas oligoaromativorans]
MPLYDYQCAAEGCGLVTEEFRRYEHRDDPKDCTCGGAMRRVFLPPQVMRDITEYTSPIDGTRITTRSQHRDHMKRHGVIEMGNDKPKPHQQQSSRPWVREELRTQVNRMKSEGTWRDR